MQDVLLYVDDEKGSMAKPASYFCPSLNCIQMGAWKHSSRVCEKQIGSIWNTSSSKTWVLSRGHSGEIE